MLTVLTGGARSGKSTLAVTLADGAPGPVVFVATCPRIEGDDELDRRIEAHRAERPAGWTTIETQHELADVVAAVDGGATVVIDCLTLWVSNLLFRGDDEATINRACRQTLRAVGHRPGQTIAVTNEVGLGIVPIDSATRTFRDVLGRVNQAWVAAADRALFLVAGKGIPLHDPSQLL